LSVTDTPHRLCTFLLVAAVTDVTAVAAVVVAAAVDAAVVVASNSKEGCGSFADHVTRFHYL